MITAIDREFTALMARSATGATSDEHRQKACSLMRWSLLSWLGALADGGEGEGVKYRSKEVKMLLCTLGVYII